MKINFTIEEWEQWLRQPGRSIHFLYFMTSMGFWVGSQHPDTPKYLSYDNKDYTEFYREAIKRNFSALQIFLISAAVDAKENPQVYLDNLKTSVGRQKLIDTFEELKRKAKCELDEEIDPVIASLRNPEIEYKNETIDDMLAEIRLPGALESDKYTHADENDWQVHKNVV